MILLLTNPALGQAVEGVAWLATRFVGPPREDALRAAETAHLIADSIDAIVESMQAALIETARQGNLNALYSKAVPMG